MTATPRGSVIRDWRRVPLNLGHSGAMAASATCRAICIQHPSRFSGSFLGYPGGRQGPPSGRRERRACQEHDHRGRAVQPSARRIRKVTRSAGRKSFPNCEVIASHGHHIHNRSGFSRAHEPRVAGLTAEEVQPAGARLDLRSRRCPRAAALGTDGFDGGIDWRIGRWACSIAPGRGAARRSASWRRSVSLFSGTVTRVSSSKIRPSLSHKDPGRGDTLTSRRALDEVPVQEIATRLGLGPQAGESLLTRARVAFRDAFRTLAAAAEPPFPDA